MGEEGKERRVEMRPSRDIGERRCLAGVAVAADGYNVSWVGMGERSGVDRWYDGW